MNEWAMRGHKNASLPEGYGLSFEHRQRMSNGATFGDIRRLPDCMKIDEIRGGSIDGKEFLQSLY